MNREMEATDFFVAGGTLRPNTPSYTKRPADDELFNLALAGEFCYVLTARQMGKSSLMIRTARRLQERGVHSVVIDLTKVGIEVSAEQWYLGLLTQLKRNLRLPIDLEAWWQEHSALGPVQRFTDFLHDVLLQEIEGQIVIFMDEIDTTLNLPFSDDFFAAIRFIYNARASDPIYEALTFVLLGVAIPADLIKDRSRTPFNIGQGIDLSDFKREDTQILQEGVKRAYPEKGDAIFNRIFYWTHGHPYLTQKLCLSVAEEDNKNGAWSDDNVDALVERLFLSKEARKETNLQFVRDYVNNSPHRQRLMGLYRQVYDGKKIPEDERSLEQNQLKLFGLVRVDNSHLQVRNEIYRHVFNLDWVKANTPIDWTRRIAMAMAVLILILMGLVGYSYWQGQQRVVSEQAQLLIDNFRNTSSADVQITSLAGLYDLPNFEDQADKLFFEELTREDRLALFQNADPQAVGSELVRVVRGLYTNLENNERDNALLEGMVAPLRQIEDSRAVTLATEIQQWLQGRALYNEGDPEQAVTVYDLVIGLNDRNPGLYYDRGVAYTALDEPEAALADFGTALGLDETRKGAIEQVIMGNTDLYDTALLSNQTTPALIALLPTPTATSTPKPTATPSSTATPIVTNTPEPATATPTTQPTAETVIQATPEALVSQPTDTPTPLPTNTPTPRPAMVVYVQSSGQTHELGIVTSAGELMTSSLHQRAAAPTWSPDGRRVAFYGEQGISELGGIYAQGSGVWIIEVATGNLQLLYPVDHIRNMTWSPDGSKLAFEVGPPNVTHQVFVIDAGNGQETRFPGEQPAWSPGSNELIVKSCAPECGLWRVGLDGSGGRLVSPDSTDSYPTWSPTGEYVVFASRARTGDWEIYRLRLADNEMVNLTNRPGTDTTPVFSPDGLEIYLRTDAFGDWRVMAMSIDGSQERVVRDSVGPSEDWGLARPAVR